jgi:hypothetical protein
MSEKDHRCRYPGCTRPRSGRRFAGRGGSPTYCDLPEHNHDTAYRARKRAAEAEQAQELERLRGLLTAARADVA